MNFRSLMIAAVALLVGILVGVFLRGDPPEANAPTRSAARAEVADAIVEPASEPIAITRRAASETIRAQATPRSLDRDIFIPG